MRQLTGWTYEELAFHLADFMTYRAFCRVSALNDQLVTSAAARAIEPARTVRMDATVVPVAIHPPTDSSLLLDAVRVLDRRLRRTEQEAGFTAYHRHVRRAKRRAIEIAHLAP